MMHEGNGISFQKSADIFLQEFHFFSIYIFRSPEHLKEFLPVSFFSQFFFVIVSNLFLLLIFHSCHFSDNIFFQVYRDWSLSFFFVFKRYFSSFLQIGKKIYHFSFSFIIYYFLPFLRDWPFSFFCIIVLFLYLLLEFQSFSFFYYFRIVTNTKIVQKWKTALHFVNFAWTTSVRASKVDCNNERKIPEVIFPKRTKKLT